MRCHSAKTKERSGAKSLLLSFGSNAGGVLILLLLAMASHVSAESLRVKEIQNPANKIPFTKSLAFSQTLKDGEIELQLFRLQGEGVDWSPDGRKILYDAKAKNGYYNVHICNVDGTDDRSLSPLKNGLPRRHMGSPAWHPGEKFFVCAQEKDVHQGSSMEAIPGFGGRSDICVVTVDGSKTWRVTNTSDSNDAGVLLPRFSHDGKLLTWTERCGRTRMLQPRSWFGKWVIKVADFAMSANGPVISNVRTITPKLCFNEGYGFSPDDKQIIFCSDFEVNNALQSQIYTVNIDGSNLKRLTEGNAYNEHASYSPDGRHVVWMSNKDNKNGGTDWWMMHSDGSHKQRLTHFNQPGFPESGNRAVYACLTSWAPSGDQFLGGVQYSLLQQEGRIFLVNLQHSLLD